jgi:uncharacterized tellurite resistance protein B-like protein
MSEIKISVSEKLDELIQRAADKLGIKKAEFVKHVIVGSFRDGMDKG